MTPNKALEAHLYPELVILYQRLENELKQLNPGCTMCGTCCNFSKFDHVLYTSSIEVSFIKRNVEIPQFDISDNICPFLKDNQCSIRNFRTLGCRIFYCNSDYKEISQDVYEKYHRRVKDLYKNYNIPWKYLPFLNQLADLRTKPLIPNQTSSSHH